MPVMVCPAGTAPGPTNTVSGLGAVAEEAPGGLNNDWDPDPAVLGEGEVAVPATAVASEGMVAVPAVATVGEGMVAVPAAVGVPP